MSDPAPIERVLVTGATAPLGVAIVERLLADPTIREVIAVGREPAATLKPTLARALTNPRLSYVQLDLRRAREVHRLLYGVGRRRVVDGVIHAAFHRSARAQGRSVHRLNVDATRELLRLLDRHPTIRRLVFRSHAAVYGAVSSQPDILDEDQPLNLKPSAPQWIRDRVEADLVACTRMGLAPYDIAVLRSAECLAPGCGSQLHDFLRSAVCLRPFGFDPMVNVVTLADLAAALVTAVTRVGVQGVFNIPGADTLPLSSLIHAAGRADVGLPGPLLAPLYRWRSRALGTDFRYDLNAARFHYNAILDGRRAREVLGYVPRNPVDWEALRGRVSVERRALSSLASRLPWGQTLRPWGR